jgi:hypothetical protein
MYDESIQRALRRHKIKPITLPAPLIQTLIANFKGESPRSQIITGTAGDGKTYHCREVWTALGGSDDVWNDSDKVKTVEIGHLSLTIVKDLSELREDESSALIENVARDVVNAATSNLYLLAANHGQLLEKLKSAPQTAEVQRIGKSIEDLLVTGKTADEGVLLGLSDLSRSPAADTAMQIVDAITLHEGWSGCGDCTADSNGAICPILENRRRLIGKDGDPFKRRLTSLIELSERNGSHLRRVIRRRACVT